ncbi:MAG: hypothetical protein M3Z66_01855 [Chloroflexota bacterium]|nr:hypothetical protein [Chloroflexota bacterium]
MPTVIPWFGFVLGLVIVLITFGSMINTLVVPRPNSSRISYLSWRATQLLFLQIAKRLSSYEAKDRVLALLGPVSLITLLLTWLVLLITGYALLLWPQVQDDFGQALRISGSSIFTLGIAFAGGADPTILIFLAAATGLTAIALLIGYLPSIYGAYNRRETQVTMLESRAGEPAWGPELLAREAFINALDTLPQFYTDWERWAADLAESHVSYPWLIWFRSPHPLRSWIIGLLSVLDSAALYLALSPSQAPSEARSCLRMGFTAFRNIAGVFNLPYNVDPLPNDPIMLTYDQFLEGIERIRMSGFDMERTPEEAWPHFRGWRVNYESIAYSLADLVVVVPSLWSGPRRYIPTGPIAPRRPKQRSPEHPEGVEKMTREKQKFL